ncbi:MAG TPA: DHA2 family efflux MFS transporter permease subunit [Candidatus Acidoferrum sp.]|nr:DHA2 family efflux MFS transporter permease subunit [Candidatus Acidoferrum sp.]
MKTPCDEQAIRSSAASKTCAQQAAPWILAATILASSLAFIDSTIVNVAAPKFQAAFHATVVDVQWVIESYGIVLSALILAGGALGDWLGRRLVFVSGVAIFAVASAGCGMANSIHMLVIARSLQGIGAALLVPGSLAIISASFDESARGRAIGAWSGFTSMTMALGPVLGGWLIEHVSWRWAFFVNLPLAAAVIVISLWRVPESRNPQMKQLDWGGALLATGSLAALVTGLIESSQLGWRSPLVYGGLTAGAVLLILFVRVESRRASPMVSFQLFRSRAFLGANLVTLLLYAAISVFFFLFPVSLMQVYGYTATAVGAAGLPLTLLMFLLSRWSGGLVARYGGKIPLIIGPLLVAAGFSIFAMVLAGGGDYWKSFFPGMLVLGFGMAVTVAPLTTVVMNSIDQNHSGAASGINNAVARLAGVLSIALVGILLVSIFSAHLERSLQRLSLSPEVTRQIRSREIELAGMELPQNLDEVSRRATRQAVSDGFLAGFRVVLFSCSGLGLASAAVAWLFVPKK